MANGFNSVEFFAAFVVLMIATGAIIPVTLVWLAAISFSFLFRRFVTERRLSLPGKPALIITGCSSGIGKHSALTLSREGFTVFATVRKQADATELSKHGPGLVPVLCDITKADQVEKAVTFINEQVEKDRLYIHGVINNAGVMNSQSVEMMTSEAFLGQFNVNVFAQVEFTKKNLPLLRNRPHAPSTAPSPRLVFVSSGSGQVSPPTIAPYAASKHALEAIVDGLRVELKPWAIEVVCVAPGKIDTEFHSTADQQSLKNLSNAAVEDPKVRDVYEKMFRTINKRHNDLKGAPVSQVTDAFRYVLLAKKPPARVPVGLDMLAVSVVILLPDRIRDLILG